MTIETICQLGDQSVYRVEDDGRTMYVIEEWHQGRRVSLKTAEAKETLESDLEDGQLQAFIKDSLQYETPSYKRMA